MPAQTATVLLAYQDYSPLKHTIKRAIRTSQLSWLFGVLFWDICGWRFAFARQTGKRPHLHPAKNATRSPCSHEYPVPHSSRLERTHLDAKSRTSWTRDSVNKACCREAPRRPPTDDICRMQDYFLDLDSKKPRFPFESLPNDATLGNKGHCLLCLCRIRRGD